MIMSNQANALAERIELGAEVLADLAESLSDAEWQTIVPNDQRPVGVLVHHVANMYPLEIDLVQQLAMGKPITGVTWDAVDQINAQHAEEHAIVSKQETIQLLRDNSKSAADKIRKLTDEQLNNAETISLYADAPLTTQFFIEDHPLRHSFHHLANIRAVLSR
ncbi:MAG: DinB family protein [Anaerolineaceae bacterium]|nr:DinB family protein [Anaerolineaceae bacterium]